MCRSYFYLPLLYHGRCCWHLLSRPAESQHGDRPWTCSKHLLALTPFVYGFVHWFFNVFTLTADVRLMQPHVQSMAVSLTKVLNVTHLPSLLGWFLSFLSFYIMSWWTINSSEGHSFQQYAWLYALMVQNRDVLRVSEFILWAGTLKWTMNHFLFSIWWSCHILHLL